jgi:hypothetical protein
MQLLHAALSSVCAIINMIFKKWHVPWNSCCRPSHCAALHAEVAPPQLQALTGVRVLCLGMCPSQGQGTLAVSVSIFFLGCPSTAA